MTTYGYPPGPRRGKSGQSEAILVAPERFGPHAVFLRHSITVSTQNQAGNRGCPSAHIRARRVGGWATALTQRLQGRGLVRVGAKRESS